MTEKQRINFENKVKSKLNSRGLTQKWLADEIGISVTGLNRQLRGTGGKKLSEKTIKKIEMVLF